MSQSIQRHRLREERVWSVLSSVLQRPAWSWSPPCPALLTFHPVSFTNWCLCLARQQAPVRGRQVCLSLRGSLVDNKEMNMSKHFLEKVAINSKNGNLSQELQRDTGPLGCAFGGYSLPSLKCSFVSFTQTPSQRVRTGLGKGKTKEEAE